MSAAAPQPDQPAKSIDGTPDGKAAPVASADAIINQVQGAAAALSEQVAKVIVGQEEVVEQLFITLFCRGHAVLVGVPGLAKTLVISTIARALNLQFSRIQFTPDLMPSDITGTEVIEEDRASGKRQLRFVRGPLFANVILADEINRTPPKTQAALLEAMQEHHVTVGGVRHPLPEPFFVLATQNPIEQEGTYPLPEAQLDRFLFMIHVGYPSEDEEFEVVRRTTARRDTQVTTVLNAEQVLQIQTLVRDVPAADYVVRYALRLARATRLSDHSASLPGVAKAGAGSSMGLPFVRQYLSWGAGPRASQALVLAGKARAIIQGRSHVTPQDIRAVAYPVLRHRLITNFNAEADGVHADDLVTRLLDAVPLDQSDPAEQARMNAVMK